MSPQPARATPLVLLANWGGARMAIPAEWLPTGAVVVRARSPEGCLRMAVAVGPDLVLVDGRFPARFDQLLRRHPMSARVRLVRVPAAPDTTSIPKEQAPRPRRLVGAVAPLLTP